jgi:hypothetical protein
MPRSEVGRTLIPSERAGFWCSDVSPSLAPTGFNGEKGRKGDASFVNNTIKGSLTCQNNVPAPASSANNTESIQGQCAA